MTPDRQTQLGLIHALLADPDDATPRLIYADWLTDRGDPLGEVVRVQAALDDAEQPSTPAASGRPSRARNAARISTRRTRPGAAPSGSSSKDPQG